MSKSQTGVKLIMCAEHNNLIVKHRDAARPPKLEQDLALVATEQEP